MVKPLPSVASIMDNRISVVSASSSIDREVVLSFLSDTFRDNCGRQTLPVFGKYKYNGVELVIKSIFRLTPNKKCRGNEFIVCEGSRSLQGMQTGVFVFPASDESRFLQLLSGGGPEYSGTPMRLPMGIFNDWLTKPMLVRPCDCMEESSITRAFLGMFKPAQMYIRDSSDNEMVVNLKDNGSYSYDGTESYCEFSYEECLERSLN